MIQQLHVGQLYLKNGEYHLGTAKIMAIVEFWVIARFKYKEPFVMYKEDFLAQYTEVSNA